MNRNGTFENPLVIRGFAMGKDPLQVGFLSTAAHLAVL